MRKGYSSSIFVFLSFIPFILAEITSHCSYCDGVSDYLCSLKLDGVVESLSDDGLYALYLNLFPSGRCDDLDQSSCLSIIDEYLSGLSFDRKTDYFKNACESGYLTPELSSLDSCSYCEGMNTISCTNVLDSLVSAMTDDERLEFEKLVLHGSRCSDLDDASCLSLLDSSLSNMPTSSRFDILFGSCISQDLDISNIRAFQIQQAYGKCSLCRDLSDSQCLTTLDNSFNLLKEKQRIAILSNLFPEASSKCSEDSETECSTVLQQIKDSLPDDQKLKLLKDSCEDIELIAGESINFDQLVPSSSSCSLCSELTDELCLSKLLEHINSFNDEEKVQILQLSLGISCSSVTSGDCLESLSSQLDSMVDKDKFLKLSDSCTVGSLTISYSDCGVCSSLPDKLCLNELDSTFNNLEVNYQAQLVKEYSDSKCSSNTDNDCVLEFTSKPDTERLSNLASMCKQGVLETIIDVELLSSCPICSDLDDEECLDRIFENINSIPSEAKLITEMSLLGYDCGSSLLDECIAQMDSLLNSMSTDDLISLFRQACSSGTINFLSSTAQVPSQPSSPEKEVSGSKKQENELPLKPDESKTKKPNLKSDSQAPAQLNVKSLVVQLKTRDDFSCPICDDLSDSDCSDSLLTYIHNLNDNDRLVLEKLLFDSECSSVTEPDCLSYFDELLLSLSNNNNKNEILLEACSEGIFASTVLETEQVQVLLASKVNDKKSVTETKQASNVAADIGTTLEENECNVCDSLNQDDCLVSMTDYLSKLADKARLTIEKDIFGDDLCGSMTDRQCLTYLESYVSELSEDELYSKLFDACTAGMFEQTTSIEIDPSTVQASCSSCHDLSDSDCLSVLTVSFENFNNHMRMTTEQVMFQEECSDMNDNACLKYLNSIYEKLSDEERFTALKIACDAGLIHASSSFATSNPSESYSMIFWGWVSAGFFAFGIAIHQLRSQKKRQYLSIPDSPVDFELEI